MEECWPFDADRDALARDHGAIGPPADERHSWILMLLLGGWFHIYAMTGSIAPGMFADKILAPAAVSLFGLTGLASFTAGPFIGTMIAAEPLFERAPETAATLGVYHCLRGRFTFEPDSM